MFRSISYRSLLAVAFGIAVTVPSVAAQKPDGGEDKKLDIRSSVGDLHVGSDADARKIGLPLYPGARPKSDDKSRDNANLSIFTEAFGFKLVVANYDSDDAPSKVIDFYRNKLKKYGKVLECHTQKHGGDVDVHADDDKDSDGSKQLKCDGDNTGPVTELKVGTEDHQHVVAIEPNGRSGSTFALVYVHARGKQGDI
jgi:hypothetical protein